MSSLWHKIFSLVCLALLALRADGQGGATPENHDVYATPDVAPWRYNMPSRLFHELQKTLVNRSFQTLP